MLNHVCTKNSIVAGVNALLVINANIPWGAWLAQLEKHLTHDFRVISSSLMWGIEITLKKKTNKPKT